MSWSFFNNYKPFESTKDISGFCVLTILSAVVYYLDGCVPDLLIKLKLQLRY